MTQRHARYRIVNVQVVLTNSGPARFRGTFAGSLIAGANTVAAVEPDRARWLP